MAQSIVPSLLECHFTWDFINLKSLDYINERIETIKFDIEFQDRNLPQNCSILGFLYLKLFEDGRNEEDKKNAFFNLDKALAESGGHPGYSAVAHANLIHYNQIVKSNDGPKKIAEHHSKYKELCKGIKIEKHPEVLAMKGFTASFFNAAERSINFYHKALKHEESAEWLVGLALAKTRHNSRRLEPVKKEIEIIWRQAIELDPTYIFAKLKLADALWSMRGDEKKEEIEDIIEEVQDSIPGVKDSVPKIPDSIPENILFMEIIADLWRKTRPDDDNKGLKLFKKCYEFDKKRAKTLRGLGGIYSTKWQKNRLNKNLTSAIKFYSEQSDQKGAMPFDLINISNVHLQAYKFFKSSYDKDKKKEHEDKICKEMLEKVLKQSNLDENPKSKIQTTYHLSEIYETFPDENKERVYLKKVLQLGKEMKDNVNLIDVKKAEKRLLKYKYEDKIEEYKTKADIEEQNENFDSALYYIKKAIKAFAKEQEIKGEEPKSETNKQANEGEDLNESKSDQEQLLLRREAGIYFKKVKNINDKTDLDIRPSLAKLNEKIDALNNGFVKFMLINQSQKLKWEAMMSSNGALKDLRQNVSELEDCLLNLRKYEIKVKEKVLDVARHSRNVLEESVKYIQIKLYPVLESKEVHPKAEQPKAEQPKAEQPKAEQPKAEQPKAEQPEVEQPKAGQPKAEQPEVEQPKAEQPKAEQPKAEKPKAEQPKVQQPKTEQPKAEQPEAEQPEAKQPKAEQPKAEKPKAEKPKAEKPKAEQPKAEQPKAEQPKAEQPEAEQPKAEKPKTEQPKAEQPEAEQPKAEQPKVEQLKVKQPKTKAKSKNKQTGSDQPQQTKQSQPPRTEFSFPNVLDYVDKDRAKREELLKKGYYKSNGWNNEQGDFASKYPKIHEHFVKILDTEKYTFLLKLRIVRNIASHGTTERQIEKLDKHIPNISDQIALARLSTNYAKDVFEFFTREVDEEVEKRERTHPPTSELEYLFIIYSLAVFHVDLYNTLILQESNQ